MRARYMLFMAAVAALLGSGSMEAHAQRVQPVYATSPGDPSSFNSSDLVESGHQFFGSASRGLALAVQEAVRRWGEPNGYILGQEASGAFFGGRMMTFTRALAGGALPGGAPDTCATSRFMS